MQICEDVKKMFKDWNNLLKLICWWEINAMALRRNFYHELDDVYTIQFCISEIGRCHIHNTYQIFP